MVPQNLVGLACATLSFPFGTPSRNLKLSPLVAKIIRWDIKCFVKNIPNLYHILFAASCSLAAFRHDEFPERQIFAGLSDFSLKGQARRGSSRISPIQKS
jgi:hypothetical protein